MPPAPARRRADVVAIAVAVIAPIVALAPAWWDHHLLGPGDGAALHYPLRTAVWRAWQAGELPAWNPAIFLGTPLLGAYRPGALFPPTVALALVGDPFVAFQSLVLFSLSAAAALMYVYLRRLGAHPLGGLVGGLSYALGAYLVPHLGDTATLTAAPGLPLLLLAAEAHVRRTGVDRAAGLAVVLALVLLAGSPEASRAALALLAGRLLVAYLPRPSPRVPPLRLTLLALVAALLLAGPQIGPALDAARHAGRPVTGLAEHGGAGLPGLTGLALRYLSATPAPALALAALPLFREQLAIRVLVVALGLSLLLQWGASPLAAPGALPLVFDVALSVLAGLSLSAQWTARREPRGARLRAVLLAGSVASALALSIAATAGGPLPETLAGAVGVLAISQILYHAQASSPDRVKATAWVLPLVIAFVLQPHGRGITSTAPPRALLEQAGPMRHAVEKEMGARLGARTLTLAERWPAEPHVLAWANEAILAGRRNANGYDPMVALATRQQLGGMGPGGTLPPSFFRTDPSALPALGIAFVQAPAGALAGGWDAQGRPQRIDVAMAPGDARFFAIPMTLASRVEMVTALSDAVGVPHGTPVATVDVRLATGRSFTFPLTAGVDTAEWAWRRADVFPLVAHRQPPPFEPHTDGGGALGDRYLARLELPGRYWIDGVRVETTGPGVLTVFRLVVKDAALTGRTTVVGPASAWLSDTRVFRERLAMPGLRLFDVPASRGEARVVDGPRAQAVEGQRPSPQRIELRAEGPGQLVLAEGFDRGWSAQVDGVPVSIERVERALMGVPLEAGHHRIVFRYRPPGFTLLVLAALLTAVALVTALAVARRRRAEP